MNPVPDMHRDVGISLKNRRNFMNPYLTVIGGACLFLLAAAWLITAENRRQKKERLKQIREQSQLFPGEKTVKFRDIWMISPGTIWRWTRSFRR